MTQVDDVGKSRLRLPGGGLSVGLRERKKARQRASILETAVELSRSRGFDALRVCDLTEQLEISEATFFNYFPSRSSLLDAWLEDELANAFAELASGSRSLRPTLRQRVRTLAERCSGARGLEAAAWQQARVQLAAPAAVSRSDLVEALAAARDAGELRRDVPAQELAEQLVAGVALALCTGHEASDRELQARAGRALDLVLDGARRRHERVRLRGKEGLTSRPAH